MEMSAFAYSASAADRSGNGCTDAFEYFLWSELYGRGYDAPVLGPYIVRMLQGGEPMESIQSFLDELSVSSDNEGFSFNIYTFYHFDSL
jgi:hypothetical protein